MTRCPLCDFAGARQEVHAHLAAEHADAVETWIDQTRGRMRYRVTCPRCGAAHESSVKPRTRDPGFLTEFAREIRLVAFDMLLNHDVAEHAEAASEAAAADSGLPAYGPGGGRGRPGAGGIPLPPGMDEPELPGWARQDPKLKVTHVQGSDR